MATRTISQFGGRWDAIRTWAEGVIPTAADNVVATASSGALNIIDCTADADGYKAKCNNLDLTLYNNRIYWNGCNIQINGSLTIGEDVVYAYGGLTGFYPPNIYMCSSTDSTVTANGKNLGYVYLRHSTSVTFLDDFEAVYIHIPVLSPDTLLTEQGVFPKNGLEKPIKGVLSTPPLSPSKGDRYLILEKPSGDWASFAVNSIAEWIPSYDYEKEIYEYVFSGESWVGTKHWDGDWIGEGEFTWEYSSTLSSWVWKGISGGTWEEGKWEYLPSYNRFGWVGPNAGSYTLTLVRTETVHVEAHWEAKTFTQKTYVADLNTNTIYLYDNNTQSWGEYIQKRVIFSDGITATLSRIRADVGIVYFGTATVNFEGLSADILANANGYIDFGQSTVNIIPSIDTYLNGAIYYSIGGNALATGLLRDSIYKFYNLNINPSKTLARPPLIIFLNTCTFYNFTIDTSNFISVNPLCVLFNDGEEFTFNKLTVTGKESLFVKLGAINAPNATTTSIVHRVSTNNGTSLPTWTYVTNATFKSNSDYQKYLTNVEVLNIDTDKNSRWNIEENCILYNSDGWIIDDKEEGNIAISHYNGVALASISAVNTTDEIEQINNLNYQEKDYLGE